MRPGPPTRSGPRTPPLRAIQEARMRHPHVPSQTRETACQPSYNPEPSGSVTFWTDDPPDRSIFPTGSSITKPSSPRAGREHRPPPRTPCLCLPSRAATAAPLERGGTRSAGVEQLDGGAAGTRMRPTFPLLLKLPARVSEIAHFSRAGARGIPHRGRWRRNHVSKGRFCNS